MEQSSALLPKLRQELRLHKGPMVNDGSSSWVVYDPVRHRYFQIDAAAYELLGLWRDMDTEAFMAMAEAQLGREVSSAELEKLITTLYANNLTEEAPGGDARAYAHQIAGTKQSIFKRAIHNYLFFKIPLVRPNRFLAATLPVVEPLFTRAAFLLVLATTIIGLYLASRQWEIFGSTFLDFLSWEGLVFYGLSLVFIKTLHELGHAYTAARAGVRVNTMGIAFMVMMPLLFTDVTDAWKLKSRRQKLFIAGAGMAVELAIAGIATFLWVFLPDGAMRSIAFVLATTSWILSVAVNVNPFMRFDGYYLLADTWGIANLQTRAFAMARWWLREVLFQLGHQPPEAFAPRTRKCLIAYAIGTWIYRLVLFLGIALLVYHMFFKVLGILLFAVEIMWFIALPIWNELMEWWEMRAEIMMTRRSLIAATVLCGILAILFIPWSGTVRVPAVALAEQEFHVYAPRPALVDSLSLKDGAYVSAGAHLAVLKSSALDFEIANTRQNIALAEARLHRIAGDKTDRSQRDVILSQLASHREKIAGLLDEEKRMTLVAPFSGTVRDTLYGLRAGDWIDKATVVAVVVADGKQEAHGYIHEDDVWKIGLGQAAYFVPEDPLLARRIGRVMDIAHTGSLQLDILDVSSVYGGAVPSDKDENGDIRPRTGRYLVKVSLGGDPMERVVRGMLHLSGQSESFASAAWRRILQVLVRESGI